MASSFPVLEMFYDDWILICWGLAVSALGTTIVSIPSL
jgi:hypothetical protein